MSKRTLPALTLLGVSFAFSLTAQPTAPAPADAVYPGTCESSGALALESGQLPVVQE